MKAQSTMIYLKKEENRNIIIYIFEFIMFPKECL